MRYCIFMLDVVATISSQRYLDPSIVAAKRASADYAVQLVLVDIEGEQYAVVVDGHHSLAAAKADRVSPDWDVLDASDELSQRTPRDPMAFLESQHNGDDYYDVSTGINVW